MNDSDPPMFSIVMPVYNHAAYVGEAIESVLAQTWTDWELHVVDDGSTDGSGRIVADWAAKDRRIHAVTQANAGPAAARNNGARRTRGPWLAYLDSDDIYYPDALAHYADFIARCPEATFIYGYRHRLTANGAKVELPGEFQDHITGTNELFGRMYLSHLCVCYRRELLATAGGYDERLRSVEDYDLYLRMSMHTKFWPLGKPTGLRRRHGSNISRQTGYSRMLQGAILQRFVERHGGRDVLEPAQVARRLGKIYYAAGRQYFKSRCFAQAGKALKKALGYKSTFKGCLLLVLANALAILGRRDRREFPEL